MAIAQIFTEVRVAGSDELLCFLTPASCPYHNNCSPTSSGTEVYSPGPQLYLSYYPFNDSFDLHFPKDSNAKHLFSCL